MGYESRNGRPGAIPTHRAAPRIVGRAVCQSIVVMAATGQPVPAGEADELMLTGYQLREQQLTTKIPRPHAGRKSRRTYAAPWTRPPVLEA